MRETKLIDKYLNVFTVKWRTIVCSYCFMDSLPGKVTVKISTSGYRLKVNVVYKPGENNPADYMSLHPNLKQSQASYHL